MSLRARLMSLVLLATLLPLLLMAARFVRDSQAEIQAAQTTLATAADSIVDNLDHRVQGTAQLHFGLAHSRLLDSGDRAACSAYLSDVRAAYPQYTGILTVLPDGQLFCDSLQTGRSLNLTDRGYFQRALDPRNSLVLEPVFGRLTGNSVLQIVAPVRSEGGALRFILVASLNLKDVVRAAPLPGLLLQPELLLIDSRGTMMVGPQPGTSLAGTPLFGLARAQAGGGVADIVGADGQAQVWAVGAPSAQRSTGLVVLLGLPRKDLVAPARRRLTQDLLLLAAVAGMLAAGVWLLAERGIRRPVGRISAMARDLGAGDLGVRIPAPYPRGELGGLMAVLNSTAESLQRQRAAIDELGLKLRQAQKLEAIGTLAGGIAHDFNNILGAILGNVSIANEDALAGRPTLHSLDQIRRAALRARDLVQRIQAFSRHDRLQLAAQPLSPIVDEVLALVRVALPPGVTLQTELSTAPLRVAADATQLHQVLMNLCSNAWQALDGWPGTLTVGLDQVAFDADLSHRPAGLQPGRHAHLWVSDTGCGIAVADRERIFEPFFTTKGTQGTGLGLSVVHGIVSSHHGAIVVDSAPGQGSHFHVYLPLLADTAEPTDTPTVPVRSVATAVGHGERVLYLDDDEVMGLLVDKLLTRNGYRVATFSHATAAMAALTADAQAWGLVVTDFNMPDVSGLDFSRQVAALRPDLPVIMISGYIFDELPAQARRAGVREVIRKQHVLEDLAAAVARAIAPVPEPPPPQTP